MAEDICCSIRRTFSERCCNRAAKTADSGSWGAKGADVFAESEDTVAKARMPEMIAVRFICFIGNVGLIFRRTITYQKRKPVGSPLLRKSPAIHRVIFRTFRPVPHRKCCGRCWRRVGTFPSNGDSKGLRASRSARCNGANQRAFFRKRHRAEG